MSEESRGGTAASGISLLQASPSLASLGCRIQGVLSLPTSRPLSSQADLQRGPGNLSCFGSLKTPSKPYRSLAALQEGPILHSHTRLMLATNSSFKQSKSEPPLKFPPVGFPHFALGSPQPLNIFVPNTVPFPLPQNLSIAGECRSLPAGSGMVRGHSPCFAASWGTRMPKNQQVARVQARKRNGGKPHRYFTLFKQRVRMETHVCQLEEAQNQ